MAKVLKKFLALVLVLSLVMGMSGMAYAADDETVEGAAIENVETAAETSEAENEEIIEEDPAPVEETTVGTIPTENGEQPDASDETPVAEEIAASVEEEINENTLGVPESGSTVTEAVVIDAGDADVTISNVTFADGGSLTVNTTGNVRLTGCAFTGTASVRNPVKLNVGSAVISRNTFTGTGYYNAIEFGIGETQNSLGGAKISDNRFEAAIKNNYISFYNLKDNANIVLVNNPITLANRESNAIRVSNPKGAVGVKLTLTDNEFSYDKDSAESEYEGLILFQAFDNKGGESQTNEFEGITLNVTGLTSPANRLLYVYEDGAIVTTNQPVVTGDETIEGLYTAKVGNRMFTGLQDAIDAAGTGETVVLLNDTTESVVIGAGQEIVLDLNGCTLSGAVKKDHDIDSMTNVITNKGTLTIKSSIEGGTVMGGTDTGASYDTGRKDKDGKAVLIYPGRQGIAIVNENGATCTIKSSTIKRGDNGTFGNYTVQNAGKMYINGGLIENNSNKSSLLINYNYGPDANGKCGTLSGVEMEITGGTIKQENYIALKNDPATTLTIAGGNIEVGSSNVNQMLLYGTVKLVSGTLSAGNGNITVLTYRAPSSGTVFKGSLEITGGDLTCKGLRIGHYGSQSSPETDPEITISGKTTTVTTSENIQQVVYNYTDNGTACNGANTADAVTVAISGGTFNNDVFKYVVKDYTTVKDGNTWTVVPDTESDYWVAKIDETGEVYHTLAEAIDAAASGQTVVLLHDATENVVIGNEITLNIPKDVTLSNSGKSHTITVNYGGKLTVTGEGTIANANNKAALFNSGEVTLSGATITCTSTAAERWYIIVNHGIMTVEKDGKVIAETKQASMIQNGYGSYNCGRSDNGYVQGQNHEFPLLTITGGKIQSLDNTAIKNEDGGILKVSEDAWVEGIAGRYAITNYHVTEISGGHIEGPVYTAHLNDTINKGELTVTGGTFNNDSGHNFVNDSTYPGSVIKISGGTFSGHWGLGKDCTANGCPNADSYDQCRDNGVCYIVPDYKAVENRDGSWSVVPDYAWRAGANDFMTFDEALAVGNGHTVTLLRDTAESITIPEGKTVTVNLGGNTLTGTAAAVVTNNGTLTIENGSLQAAPNKSYVINNKGTLTVENETTLTAFYTVYAQSNSTTIINGGIFNGSITTNGGHRNVTLTINDGAFNQILYLSAGGGSVYTIEDGVFRAGVGTDKEGNPASYGAAIELDAGTLNINGGTFTNDIDTSTNSSETNTNGNGSGYFHGVLVVCKPDSSNDTDAYVGDAVVNISGGTFFNADGGSDAIVVADFGKDDLNAGKSVVNISNASVYGNLAIYRPENANSDAKLEITGGDYTNNETGFCASGYRCTQRADGRWIVGRIPTTPSIPSTPTEPDEPLVEIEDDPTALGDRPFIFVDVHENDWFYEDVKNIFEHGLINGTTTTTYEPQTELSRGMIVTILWRIAGEPKVDTLSTFTDISEEAYYFDAINWGAENNIARGYSAEMFAPDRLVSREELAALMYRYAELVGLDLTGIDEEAFAEFGDAESVLPWFVENVKWAINAGIVKGDENGNLNPQDRATRAEAAAMVNRFIQMPEVAAVIKANSDTEAEGETKTDAE